ncbi:hypothetical protein JOE64_002432 [Microbacterium dextranolyticum]|nr:hypothetical protein [Microbacterium dextranolyticum]MBM7463963.1 hypothetical protein [Microbacterium dextranolyticum]
MSQTLGPRAAERAMSTRMIGIASCTSAHPIRTLSSRPPAYPAIMPAIMPMKALIATTNRTMPRET